MLSFTGATTGVIASFIWPSVLYLAATSSGTNRYKVKIFLAIGILIFINCTYVTLEEYQPTKKDLDLYDKTTSIMTINDSFKTSDDLKTYLYEKSQLKENILNYDIKEGIIIASFYGL